MARTLTRNRRDLVTQRLAAAGGHKHQGVTAAAHMLNDVLLGATKALVAKDFLQDVGVGHEGGVQMWPKKMRQTAYCPA